MDQWEAGLIGREISVICEDCEVPGRFIGRGYFDSPGIDGRVIFSGDCAEGDVVNVKILSADDGDLIGEKV